MALFLIRVMGQWPLLVFLTSCCGYRICDPDSLAHRYRTITIPYVIGDPDGRVTSELIHEITNTGLWRYRHGPADLILEAEVLCCTQENIGYQFERSQAQTAGEVAADPSGEIVRRLLPNESRSALGLQLALRECRTGKIVVGPMRVTSDADYDFDPLSTDDRLAVFSLGQLVNCSEAQDIAFNPLCRELARKVVDILAGLCL
jgi:hypothetical protein